MMIIGGVLLIAVPTFVKVRKSVKINQAEAQLNILSAAVWQLAWDTGKWPDGLDCSVPGNPETWDLTGADAGLLVANSNKFPKWQGPYVPDIPADPWGSQYFFDPDYSIAGVMRPVVGSFGPNCQGRNQYDDDNIYIVLN